MKTDAIKIMKILNDNGFESRIAGGAVRDILMNVSPKDFDIATVALPETVIQIFKNQKYDVVETGLQHGTVTVVMNHIPYEVTTLRVDKQTDGRHAIVEFTDDWKLDASRRDFTINAMYMDIEGKIFDYFNGQEDCKYKIVKFVGDSNMRIQEDYLRIMRWFRFIARYNGKMLIQDFNNVQNNVKGLNKISKERIFTEIMKILDYNVPRVYDIMNQTGVSNQIFGKNLDYKFASIKDFEYWFVRLHDMGVESEWFKNYKSPSNVFSHIEFLEKFKPVNVKYDVMKHGKNKIQDYAKIHGYNWNFDFEVPEFPVNGHDVMNLGFVRNEIGFKLEEMRMEWAKSDFKKTKEELMREIERK